MWLINWLLDQWDKLNLLFVNLWGEVVNLATYGLGRLQAWVKGWVDWLVSLIYYYKDQLTAALNAARDWLLGLIQNARDAATSALTSARDWLYGLIYNLARAVDTTITQVRDWLLGVITNVRAGLEAGLAGLSAWIDASLTGLETWVNAIYDQLRGAVAGLEGWIDTNILIPLLSLSSTLATFRSTYEPLLLGFFSSPGRFIFAFIETYVYRFAEYFIAGLLGGVIFAPPPRPDIFGADPGPNPAYPFATNVPDPTFGSVLPKTYPVAHAYRPAEPFVIFRTEPNATVMAPAAGVVVSTGYDPSNLGYNLTLDFGNRFTARFAYLDVLYVGAGAFVAAGQPIGAAGNSGAAPGQSLRLELFYLAGYLDPLRFVEL